MSTTATARQAIGDSGRYPSPMDRRAALMELAEAVVNERGHHEQPWKNVTQLVVPTLAAASCPNQMACFDYLCETVAVRHRFVADPDTWLVAHELPLSTQVYETWDESTEREVDEALDALMGVHRGGRR